MHLETAEPPIGRVVYRGNNNANANGGVSYANANNDASNSNTNVGSRLNYNRNKTNRRTAAGTCPQGGAEGGEPQQKQSVRLRYYRNKRNWKAEKSRERVEFGRAFIVSKKSGPRIEGRWGRNKKVTSMRREGHIIEEIVEYGNMSDSFDQVLRGTKRKKGGVRETTECLVEGTAARAAGSLRIGTR